MSSELCKGRVFDLTSTEQVDRTEAAIAAATKLLEAGTKQEYVTHASVRYMKGSLIMLIEISQQLRELKGEIKSKSG